MAQRYKHIPDLVSKAEAAKIMDVSHQAVQQMIDNNRLPCAKVGNAWVIRRVVAERMAADRKAAEERMAASVDAYYGGKTPPLPAGVAPVDPSELD